MEKKLLYQLETPCMVLHTPTLQNNIAAMQRHADACGVALRPHIKTHKMPRIAQMQMAAGAAGITCAKVSEAEVMAEGGLHDIFIAYPVIGELRIGRALELMRRVKRLILGVDSLEGAQMLSRAAEKAGLTAEVRLEIDTGKRRTGVPADDALSLALAVQKLPALRICGIYTFKSLVYQGGPTKDAALAAREEGEMLHGVANALRAQGIAIKDISGGSTPTGRQVAQTGLVTEIRPGTYVLGDAMGLMDGSISQAEVAARIYTTVVSAAPEYVVIDGGTKTFPMDVTLHKPPYNFSSYALFEGREDLCISWMNEEHGIVQRLDGGPHNLSVGDVLCLIPLHVCTALNMHNFVYLYDGATLSKQPIAARGMLF